MRDIKELRKDIDLIDRKLVELFEQRMAVVEEVAAYKIKNDVPLKDPKRETSLITKNVSLLKDEKYARLLGVFFKDLMEYSRTYQKELMSSTQATLPKDFSDKKVVYQGIEGSFSSIALTQYFGKTLMQKPVQKFEHVFEALTSKEVDYGILPIENSSTGAINEVYDLLKKHQVSIVGDVYLPIRHHLIGRADVQIDKIQSVYSHEQGFKQSQNYLKSYDWHHYTYFNTAKSVEYVKELDDVRVAAIGSRKAAEVYGLSILAEDIQDHNYNTTRFVIVANDAAYDEDANKISMIVRLAHEPQSLYKVLDQVAKHGVNMLKIESRPVPDKAWEYLFYIDIEGSLKDQNLLNLIKGIESVSHAVLILGNYYSRNGETE